MIGVLLSGCTSSAQDPIVVLAASSLSGPFTELAAQVEAEHPGTAVQLSFEGSSGILQQLREGAPADVVALADSRLMDDAVDEQLVAEPANFAVNHPALVVAPGNPAAVTGLDGSLASAKLVVCAPQVPCGRVAGELAERNDVVLQPVSEELRVLDVVGKVSSGEADAGIVYATDARAAELETVPVPGQDDVSTTYPIALATGGSDGDVFLTAVLSPEGREVLQRYGFEAP